MLNKMFFGLLLFSAFLFADERSELLVKKKFNQTFEESKVPVTVTTPEMIAVAKKRVAAKAQPWYASYELIKEHASEALNKPIEIYTKTQPGHKSEDAVHPVCSRSFCAARDCAFVWLMEGNKEYLDYSKKILLEWARTKPEPIINLESRRDYPYWDADLGLLGGVPFVFYAHAYTLVYPELTAEEIKDIRLWLTKVGFRLKYWHLAWTANDYYGNQYYNNHLSWHNAAIGAIGFALQDNRFAAFAVDSGENPRDFKEMLAGAILMPGDDTHDAHKDTIAAGEIYDRYRSHEHKGLGYAMYHGMALTYLAEMAYNNGVDLFSYTAPGGENLFLLYSYYAEFIEKDDSSLKNGLYKGDSVPTHYTHVYDWVNAHYPGHEEIEAVIKTHNRGLENKGEHHAATIGLTHIKSLD